MDEPLGRPAPILKDISKILCATGVALACFSQSAGAQQCSRGQVLIVGRHTCVSHETFQQFQRAWRTGKPAPSVTSRRADPLPAKADAKADSKPSAKPDGVTPRPPVAAEAAPVPPPNPLVAAAAPAAAVPALAAPAMSASPVAVTTVTPVPSTAPVAKVAAPAVPASAPPKAAKKPPSPFGELQLR